MIKESRFPSDSILMLTVTGNTITFLILYIHDSYLYLTFNAHIYICVCVCVCVCVCDEMPGCLSSKYYVVKDLSHLK